MPRSTLARIAFLALAYWVVKSWATKVSIYDVDPEWLSMMYLLGLFTLARGAAWIVDVGVKRWRLLWSSRGSSPTR